MNPARHKEQVKALICKEKFFAVLPPFSKHCLLIRKY